MSYTCPGSDQQLVGENNAWYVVGCSSITTPNVPFSSAPAPSSFNDCFLLCDGTTGCLGFNYVGGPNGTGAGTCSFTNGTNQGFVHSDANHVAAVNAFYFNQIVTTTYSTTTTTTTTTTSSTSSACATATTAAVTFYVYKTTAPSETLSFVGFSGPVLGATVMNGGNYSTATPYWYYTVNIAVGTTVTYAYSSNQGGIESPPRRSFLVPGNCAGTATKTDYWQFYTTTTSTTTSTTA